MADSNVTMLKNLVDPEVMADMISATLPKLIRFSPIAKIDTTLVGVPGDTITVPKYAYIGDAEDIAEGVAMGTVTLTASTTKITVKKAGKAVELTDEALLSAYGDPLGEANRQLALSIASKVDNDGYAALKTAALKFDGSAAAIGYDPIVSAVDKFGYEGDGAAKGVIYVSPAQVTTIRKDPNFLDVNKYPIANGLMVSGVIGTICGFQVVPSKKVEKDEAGTSWLNPLVITNSTDPNADPAADGTSTDAPALTIYMKRNLAIESDRDILKKTTVVSADEHYGVALSNDSKVVLASFKA